MEDQTTTKIRAILTGATGMVGEGVLHECLQHKDVEAVLVINRKPCGITHPKLKEIIHADFFNLQPIESQLQNYNTCFFCLGVSSVGKREAVYYRLTYTLTMHVAETLVKLNNNMTFCYISGTGTDSTTKGKLMWARVKGRTENDLAKLPFKKVYNFRPAVLQPTKGLKNTLRIYTYLGWMIPVMKPLMSGYFCTLKQLGLAMIHAVTKGAEKQILETKDIIALSKT
jgi:acyl-CoA synthetase (AMP-forming)/AMP-acid ligase II